MALQREDDLAWQLVEDYRDSLPANERAIAFVNLGVGDYSAVIRSVLRSLAAQRKTLTDASAAEVRAWIDCYHTDIEFGVLLSQTAPRSTPPQPSTDAQRLSGR